jgi:hypothetical protein
VRLSGRNLQAVQDLAAGGLLDWNRVAELACLSGTAPLLYSHLKRIDPAARVPCAAADMLRAFFVRNAARNLVILRRLHDILLELSRENLPVIALKGVALAEAVYGNPALRPMMDVDLLVRPEALAAAESALKRLRYRFHGDPGKRARYLREHYHLVFCSELDATTVELHWNIDKLPRASRVDIAGLWDRSVETRIAGAEARVFSPEDMVLHLGIHASVKNGFRRSLRSLWDIREVVERSPGLEWRRVAHLAADWGFTRHLSLTLRLVRELLGSPIPEDCPGEPIDDAIYRDTVARVLRCDSAPVSTLAQLLAGPALKDRIRLLRTTLSTVTSARLATLGTGYIPTLWRLMLGEPATKSRLRHETRQAALDIWLGSDPGNFNHCKVSRNFGPQNRP